MLLTEMSAYSNAVQQYGRDVANFWAQYDFSPTKRYVKKMCDLFYIDKIPQNEITKIFRAYQENAEWFDAMGINFNELSWDNLKELVLRHIGEYENVAKLPNQFYVSDDGLINIGYFNTFEEAMNFEPQNGWCTSVNQGRFEEHHDINHEMLYIIRNCKLSKGSNCRFVVAQVNLDGSRIYWDQKNNNLNGTNENNHISAEEYETSLGDAVNQLQPMKVKTENKHYNTNRNMNKKLIRLTESDLHKIVKDSVNRILNEVSYQKAQSAANAAIMGGRQLSPAMQRRLHKNPNALSDRINNLSKGATNSFNREYGYNLKNVPFGSGDNSNMGVADTSKPFYMGKNVQGQDGFRGFEDIAGYDTGEKPSAYDDVIHRGMTEIRPNSQDPGSEERIWNYPMSAKDSVKNPKLASVVNRGRKAINNTINGK